MQNSKELLEKLKKFEKLEVIANKADEAYQAEPENAAVEEAFDKAYKEEFQAMEELINGIAELTNGQIDTETAKKMLFTKRAELKKILEKGTGMRREGKIEAVWDQDVHDNSILVLEKEEGKLSLEEVKEFLTRSHNGAFKGDYVMVIRSGEGQAAVEEPKGDQWGLYKVEPGAGCPVCGNGIPFCEVQGKIDRKIDLIKRMQAEMDHRAEVEEKAVQLITEGRHGEAVTLLNTLDDSLIAGMQEEFEEGMK